MSHHRHPKLGTGPHVGCRRHLRRRRRRGRRPRHLGWLRRLRRGRRLDDVPLAIHLVAVNHTFAQVLDVHRGRLERRRRGARWRHPRSRRWRQRRLHGHNTRLFSEVIEHHDLLRPGIGDHRRVAAIDAHFPIARADHARDRFLRGPALRPLRDGLTLGGCRWLRQWRRRR